MFLISMSYLEIYNEEVKDLLTGESNMKIRESEVRFPDVTQTPNCVVLLVV